MFTLACAPPCASPPPPPPVVFLGIVNFNFLGVENSYVLLFVDHCAYRVVGRVGGLLYVYGQACSSSAIDNRMLKDFCVKIWMWDHPNVLKNEMNSTASS